jgi:hypothetical protein
MKNTCSPVHVIGHPEINDLMILFLMFNATFSSISAISWRPVLVV